MLLLIAGIIALAAATAFLLRWDIRDYRKSVWQPLHIPGEGNKWARGEDGYFDRGKSIRNSALIIGGALLIAVGGLIFGERIGSGAQYAVFIVAGFEVVWGLLIRSVVLRDEERMAANKEKQFAILRNVRRDPANAAVFIPNDVVAHQRRQVRFIRPFYDIAVPLVGSFDDVVQVNAAYRAIVEKIKALAAKPESEWWKLDRAAPLNETDAK